VRQTQLVWLERLEQEHPNLRAALSWAVERRETETGLLLAGLLWRFWATRGYCREGRAWLDQLLSLAEAPAPSSHVRARALAAVGSLMWRQGDLDPAAGALEASLACYRKPG